MQITSTNYLRLQGVAAFLISTAIVLTIMMLAKSFLIPLAWSLVIALASFRMLNRIEKRFRLNRTVSSLLFVALIFIILIVLFYFFYREIRSVIHGIPSFSTSLIESIQSMLESLEDYGIHAPVIDETQIHHWISDHSDTISSALASFGKSIADVVLIGVYLFFILNYRDNFLYFLKLREKKEEDFIIAKERANEIAGLINSFLYGLLTITLIMWGLLYIIFLVIGLKFALFFAFLVALLNLIPYIGNPLGIIIVVLFASVSSDGLMLPLLALAAIILTNTLKSYIFKPIIIGNKIDLNAFVIFLSVITGGLIWGVSGMLLFMPFAGIAKVLLESNEKTKPLVALFITLPKDALSPGTEHGSDQ